jgi:CDP-glucose 4,6-dehydratase
MSGVRILVTGNTGFTGYWLSSWLVRKYENILGFSNSTSGIRNYFIQSSLDEKIRTEFGDVNEFERLLDVARNFRPHVIVHLAAQPLVLESYRSPRETFQANVGGTVNVLEVSRLLDSVSGVLVITSDKVYSTKNRVTAFSETSPLGGSDPYSASKSAADIISSAYRGLLNDEGKLCAVIRGGNIIGGGDSSPNRVVPDLINAWSNNQPLEIRNPHATRPWQHVLDLISAYVRCIEFLLDGKREANNSFNVGPELTDQGKTVLQLIDEFATRGIRGNLVTSSPKYEESEHLRIDSSLANELIGWRPTLSFSESVQYTAEWYKGLLKEGLDPDYLVEKQLNSFFEKVEKTK